MKWLQAFTRSKSESPSPEKSGLAIGLSVGKVERTPVYLPEDAVHHHSLVVGNAGTGKTTLLAHLTVAAMERGDAVVVLDADGDLVPALLGRVSKARVEQVYWLDWGETPRRAGLNWLDMRLGLDEEAIISRFIQVSPLIWQESWSMWVEEALRMGLHTLLTANRLLSDLEQPQFTCLDLAHLFECETFRYCVLEEYISDQRVKLWWQRHFDAYPENHRLASVDPLIVRLHPFARASRLKNMMAQSQSTIPLQAVPREGAILLVNQHSPFATADEHREALSTLLLNYVLTLVQQHGTGEEQAERKRVVVVLNGQRGLPDPKTVERLAELEHAGVTFIMSTQSISEAEPRRGSVMDALLANVHNLFVFRTTGRDAQLLQPEMACGDLDWMTLSRIPDHLCHLRTHSQIEPPWSFPFEIPLLIRGDTEIAAEIENLAKRYTKSEGEVYKECVAFDEQWYDREMAYRRNKEQRKEQRENDRKGKDRDEARPLPRIDHP